MTLPDSFVEYTRELMGVERFSRFMAAFDEEPPVSVRLNPIKAGTMGDGRWVMGGNPVPWCDGGYYLPSRPAFTFDPLLHAGCYYVQEAASMFVSRVLKQHIADLPVVALDMCAAPGGKTTAALAALHPDSIVMCNEPMRQRGNILAENIQKWGSPRVIVTNNYPADYARTPLMFDIVICDVPCSGEGMFRKDEGAIAEWSVQNVENCARLQREIVAEAWTCLRTGGIMVYSTCTFNTKENEENVRWICEELGAEVLPVDIEDEWNITGSLLKDFDRPVYRFIPGTTRGEGLFMAVLRKTGEETRKKTKKGSKEAKRDKNAAPKLPHEWLANQSDYNVIRCGDMLTAIPKDMQEVYDAASSLRIISAGVTLGEVKGKDIIPSQSLALSTALHRNSDGSENCQKGAFPEVALDYRQAIDYLRKETIALPDDTPKGFVLLTYRGHPLGFVKNIGNRSNNLYPQEWKIKSTHVPEEQVVI